MSVAANSLNNNYAAGSKDGSGLAIMSQSKAQESKPESSNTNNLLHKPDFDTNQNPKHSLIYGLYSDALKSLWKILTGVFSAEAVKGLLKDRNFTLAKVIDHTLRTDFLVSSMAYIFGAWSIRIFNGNNKIFGIPIPKLPSVIAGHGASNLIAKLVGLVTSSEILNKESAENAQDETQKEVSEKLGELKWMKALDGVNKFYHQHIEAKLTKLFSMLFGVKREKSTEEGEEKTTVNPWHFGTTAGLIGLGTMMLPKDTQVYGMEDLDKSKGFIQTAWNSALYFAVSLLSRLDCYTFYNALALHPKGFGFEGCAKVAVRDKAFPPFLQTSFEVLSNLIKRVSGTKMNGAILASLVTFPVDIIGAFLSADLIGISKESRVSSNWTYIANKIWKPLSAKIESVVLPLFKVTIKPLSQALFGFFPKSLEGQYKGPADRELDPEIENQFKQQNFLWLLTKSIASIPGTLLKLLQEK